MEGMEDVLAGNSGSGGALQACMLNKQGGGASGVCPGARRVILPALAAGSPSPRPCPGPISGSSGGADPHPAISIQDRLF